MQYPVPASQSYIYSLEPVFYTLHAFLRSPTAKLLVQKLHESCDTANTQTVKVDRLCLIVAERIAPIRSNSYTLVKDT